MDGRLPRPPGGEAGPRSGRAPPAGRPAGRSVPNAAAAGWASTGSRPVSARPGASDRASGSGRIPACSSRPSSSVRGPRVHPDVAVQRVRQRPRLARAACPTAAATPATSAPAPRWPPSRPGRAWRAMSASSRRSCAGAQVRGQAEAGHVQVERVVADRAEAVAQVVQHVLARQREAGLAEVHAHVGPERPGRPAPARALRRSPGPAHGTRDGTSRPTTCASQRASSSSRTAIGLGRQVRAREVSCFHRRQPTSAGAASRTARGHTVRKPKARACRIPADVRPRYHLPARGPGAHARGGVGVRGVAIGSGTRRGAVEVTRRDHPPAGRVIPIGHKPEGMVADPRTRLLAVGLTNPDRLALVDMDTGRVVRRIALPEAPRHLSLAAAGRAGAGAGREGGRAGRGLPAQRPHPRHPRRPPAPRCRRGPRPGVRGQRGRRHALGARGAARGPSPARPRPARGRGRVRGWAPGRGGGCQRAGAGAPGHPRPAVPREDRRGGGAHTHRCARPALLRGGHPRRRTARGAHRRPRSAHPSPHQPARRPLRASRSTRHASGSGSR